MIFAPPKLDQLQIGDTLIAGMGKSTIIADLDFETYSPAGFVWNPQSEQFNAPRGTDKKGLQVTGVVAYTEHPQAEILCMAYNLKMGEGKKLWTPSDPPPTDLFYHVCNNGLLESWNVAFEYWVWVNIGIPKYGFPPIRMEQLRCAAAKSRAHALPGSLAPAGTVLNTSAQKDKISISLIRKFCIPRNPTQKDKRLRILPSEMPFEGNQLYQYCLQDIETEAEISSLVPDLSPNELEFWQCDQAINRRGVAIDVPLIKKAAAIIEQAHIKYNKELREITRGEVTSASQVARLLKWINTQQETGITSLSAESIEGALKNDGLWYDVRRVLEIRQRISSASVKKLYSMLNQVSHKGRLHELFVYHSARTGRAAGSGPQPQNLPNSGPNVRICTCGRHYVHRSFGCHWCSKSADYASTVEWNAQAVNDALEVINMGSLSMLEMFFGDAVETISGCLRGMFIAAPGHDLICSDYAAIEGVVLAALAGEEWRLEVFRSHGKIYEASASAITGLSLNEFEKHKKETGQHHKDRKLGKVAELASGYGGWIGAWKAFGADEFFSYEKIKKSILAWRSASPAIVEFWGGQERNWQPELYGLEGCAVQAILNPGVEFSYRNITYIKRGDALYCRLPSGRYITYHRPSLRPSERRPGTHDISFEGWNTNPLKGAIGWVRIDTYSGKLTENVVQAVARDILAHAIVNLEKSGYPVVLHVHDEIVSEVPEGYGSVEEFERIMSTLPPWAKDWPLKASGGWRAKRYGK